MDLIELVLSTLFPPRMSGRFFIREHRVRLAVEDLGEVLGPPKLKLLEEMKRQHLRMQTVPGSRTI
jgi:hypothetical protein